MAKYSFIGDGEGGYIAASECEWIEIESGDDEDFDELEQRMNDGEGERFDVIRGPKLPKF